jgi:hypothetical protein
VSLARRGFVFDPGAYKCQSIKCLCRGSRYGGSELVRSSSEAEPHPRGRPALERGGNSPEEVTGPRARRRFAGAVPRPSSEEEFLPRVAGTTVLVGRWGHQCRGLICRAVIYLKGVLGLFCFLFCESKWVAPDFLGDPYGCPRHNLSCI